MEKIFGSIKVYMGKPICTMTGDSAPVFEVRM